MNLGEMKKMRDSEMPQRASVVLRELSRVDPMSKNFIADERADVYLRNERGRIPELL